MILWGILREVGTRKAMEYKIFQSAISKAFKMSHFVIPPKNTIFEIPYYETLS